MLQSIIAGCVAAARFRGYRPKPVSVAGVIRWLRQYAPRDRSLLRRALRAIIFISERETRDYLVSLNARLLKRLSKSGIAPDHIIYIQIDDAGSSSPVMLNMLKEAAVLERQGFVFLDSRDTQGIHNTTNTLGGGAIVYVDDFIGTGKQFSRSQKFTAPFVVGNFAEFLLAPCICEEALERLSLRGVEPVTDVIHYVNERPLHRDSEILPATDKTRLRELCTNIHAEAGLGFDDLATMVVFYRNSPNSLPLVFRGNLFQEPKVGIFPRTTDLPFK